MGAVQQRGRDVGQLLNRAGVPSDSVGGEFRGRYQMMSRLSQTDYYGNEEGRSDSTVRSKLLMFSGLAT